MADQPDSTFALIQELFDVEAQLMRLLTREGADVMETPAFRQLERRADELKQVIDERIRIRQNPTTESP